MIVQIWNRKVQTKLHFQWLIHPEKHLISSILFYVITFLVSFCDFEKTVLLVCLI